MKPAFLRLERIAITRLLVEAFEEHDPGAGADAFDLKVDLSELARSVEDDRRWKAGLSVRLRPKKDKGLPPYKVEVEVDGFFATGPEPGAEADLARLVGINGASILYSVVREQVFSITARGAWGPLQLPTVSFADVKVSPAAEPVARRRKETARG